MLKKIKGAAPRQFAVLGLGRFGVEMVKALSAIGCEVLAVDVSEERTAEVADIATYTVAADSSEENTLKTLGIAAFDVVIIAIGENMQASIITAMTCKEMGVKTIVAKAFNAKHAKVLEKIGVDRIIVPERDSAVRTATLINNPKVNDIIELNAGYCIAEIEIPQDWKDKTLVELNVRAKHSINVLMVTNGDDEDPISPDISTVFRDGQWVLIGGLTADVKKFINR